MQKVRRLWLKGILLFTPYSPFDAPDNNRADHQQENTNASADRKVQHPADLAVAVHIQYIYRVYLIILRHLMEHGFFLGCYVPDIACGQLVTGYSLLYLTSFIIHPTQHSLTD